MASRARGGEPPDRGRRWAWAAFFAFAALTFAGVAIAIGGLLDSALLGWIGALFVFLPWAPIFLPSVRERR